MTILSSVAFLGDGSLVTMGSGSLSVMARAPCSREMVGLAFGLAVFWIGDRRSPDDLRIFASLQHSPVVSGRSMGR